MTRLVAEISMSLDGYVTGPDPGPERGLGRGGEALHTWALDSDDPVDAEVLHESVERSGAVVMGRRLFDVVDGPHGWNDEMGYGGRHAAAPAFFVVTHSVPERVRLQMDLTFVTDGVAAALERARTAAGERDVVVMGGGDVVRQCVAERLVDELRLHLAPVVLGGGTPLFGPGDRVELEQTGSRASRYATHLTYRVG
jgi:dihydrofolate reductase